MSMRAPLAQVRGHGSAKAGAHHWWAQRLTAIALVPLSLWFVASVAAVASADYATAVAWLASPWNSAMLILLIAATFYHAQLGMHVVFEDYLVRFLAILLAAVSIIAVLRTAWGS